MRSISKMMMFAMVMLAAVIATACEHDNKLSAEQAARTYLSQLHPNARERNVSCMSHDTDSNGYVSCDAIVDGRQVTLECAATASCLFGCNSGCKLRPLMQIMQTQAQ